MGTKIIEQTRLSQLDDVQAIARSWPQPTALLTVKQVAVKKFD